LNNIIFSADSHNGAHKMPRSDPGHTCSGSADEFVGMASYRSEMKQTIALQNIRVAGMNDEALLDNSGSVPNLRFVARKVRMASEYYVEATAPGRVKYRIGPFKLRARAKEWIAVRSSHWLPDKVSLL
jgi:hypothetical protein